MTGAALVGSIPWEIPGPIWLLKPLLVFAFILHLLFVNWMLGSMGLSVLAEYLGRRKGDERYFRLATDLSKWSIVNKSLAIVLGVAPLLLVSVLYSGFIYPATQLTANTWLILVPWLIGALWVCYFYYMRCDSWMARDRHLAIGLAGTALLACVPLLFATNMVLMLLPELWWSTASFFQALFYPTVWPRLLHFYVATAAMAGVFVMAIGAVYAGRGEQEAGYTDFVVRWGAGWAFWGTGLQILAGLWLLFSQPAKVFDAFWGGPYTWLVATVFCLALGFMFWLQRLRTRGAGIVWQRRELLRGLIVFVTVILLLMATTRHLVREIHLEGYTRSHDRQNVVLTFEALGKEAV